MIPGPLALEWYGGFNEILKLSKQGYKTNSSCCFRPMIILNNY